MSEDESLLADMAAGLAGYGLIPRGGFNFDAREDPPPGLSGRPARAVVLVGQAGAAPWQHFRRWLEG